MGLLAEIVETKDLLETVLFSVVAGIGVTAIYSVAIWGAARYVEYDQEGRRSAALAGAATAAVALLAVLAVIVIAVVVMTDK
jgi:cytochrome b